MNPRKKLLWSLWVIIPDEMMLVARVKQKGVGGITFPVHTDRTDRTYGQRVLDGVFSS